MTELVSTTTENSSGSNSAANMIRQAEATAQLESYAEIPDYYPIQRKFTVGHSDDPLEEEADAMADKVMRMPESSFIQRKCAHCETEEQENKVMRKPDNPFIQRKCAHCEEEEKLQKKPLASFIQRKETVKQTAVSDAVSGEITSRQGGGNRMDNNTQTFMENRFGTSFSDVRIHTGDYSVQLSRNLQAQAFTVGNNIYFNQGKYAPDSNSGKHLLAHELTHTLQQGPASLARSLQKSDDTNPKPIIESRTVGKIKVERIITPANCYKTRNSSSSLTGGFRNNKLLFEAKGCKNNVTGEAYGDLDFGEFINGAGKFVKSLPSVATSGDFGDKITKELANDFKDEKLKANLRLVLRVGHFRAEIAGTGDVSESQNAHVGVTGVIRYANGKLNIELGGGFQQKWDQAKSSGGESTFHLYTDVGPIIFHVDGKHNNSGTTVEGKIGDTDISKSQAVGVTYSDINGEKRIIFSYMLTLPEKIQTEHAPDCVFCDCETPTMDYRCTDMTGNTPKDDPPGNKLLQTQYIPLYYKYKTDEPRSGDGFPADEYSLSISRIIQYIQEGYSIDHIEGYTSPEGPLRQETPGFVGNIALSKARADKAATEIKRLIGARLAFSIFKDKARENLEAANNKTIVIKPENELYGADKGSPDIPNDKLYKHLSKDLKFPDPGEEDILNKERIKGPSLPEELQGIADQDIGSFRTGLRNDKPISHEQRLQLLYPWLRKAVVILQPPVPIFNIHLDYKDVQDVIGQNIPCTEDHKKAFADIPIPDDAQLFIDHCSEKKPKPEIK